jgi:hypothetical protein
MVDSSSCRIAVPALSRWKIAGGTGRKDRTMAQARRPRKPSVEELAQLVVGAVNALARLLEVIRHWH